MLFVLLFYKVSVIQLHACLPRAPLVHLWYAALVLGLSLLSAFTSSSLRACTVVCALLQGMV